MRKFKISIAILALTMFQVSLNAQEKKIKFSKGTLKICSAKKFTIKGYDGNEVIIKSLSSTKARGLTFATTSGENVQLNGTATFPKSTAQRSYTIASGFGKKKDSGKVSFSYILNDAGRKDGLKKLGKKYENSEYGIYFLIEERDGELIFKDQQPKQDQFVMYGNEHYEIKIPNSIKLEWKTDRCEVETKNKQQSRFFYHSDPSSLSDFSGEVDIESTLTNIRLKDVTGPVTINTVGGNVTVEFDEKKPQKLYSIYSNNGFIDFQIPTSSSLIIDAEGKYVYSDVDFNILSEKEENDFGHIKTTMRLKKGSGKTKMKLNAGYGNIYLRKQ
jgi:hypothetical protein